MIELILENRKDMAHHLVKVGSPLSKELATLFDVRANLWQNELWVNFAVPFDQGLSQQGRNQMPRSILNGDVIPLNDVADVGRN